MDYFPRNKAIYLSTFRLSTQLSPLISTPTKVLIFYVHMNMNSHNNSMLKCLIMEIYGLIIN